VYRRGAEAVVLDGRDLPRRGGDTLTGPLRVLCLAPGEWLILSGKSSAELRAHLQAGLQQYGLAFVDWSDGYAGLALEGSAARTVLSKACGLDLDSHAFPPGRCARTRLAQLPVIVECREVARFELYVARSYAHYLRDWLLDAGAESAQGISR
jgi:heterotetrameric sarcosine oxidase gamma subunit